MQFVEALRMLAALWCFGDLRYLVRGDQNSYGVGLAGSWKGGAHNST